MKYVANIAAPLFPLGLFLIAAALRWLFRIESARYIFIQKIMSYRDWRLYMEASCVVKNLERAKIMLPCLRFGRWIVLDGEVLYVGRMFVALFDNSSVIYHASTNLLM